MTEYRLENGESVTNCNQLEKIKVTDKMATEAWNVYSDLTNFSTMTPTFRMKAALEAVFAYIANQPEKPDSSIFCDCNLPGCWYCASEHKRRGLQDNDGWIEWTGDLLELPSKWKDILIKFTNGEVIKYTNGDRWIYVTENIIAYRIVAEPKEEKQDINKLSDQIQSITDQVLEMTNMIEAITEGIKEPKKQTLLQWLNNQRLGRKELHQWSEREYYLLDKLSKYFRYLEENK